MRPTAGLVVLKPKEGTSLRSRRVMSVVAVAATALLITATTANESKGGEPAGPEGYVAALNAVPHDPAADGGSNSAAGRCSRFTATR